MQVAQNPPGSTSESGTNWGLVAAFISVGTVMVILAVKGMKIITKKV